MGFRLLNCFPWYCSLGSLRSLLNSPSSHDHMTDCLPFGRMHASIKNKICTNRARQQAALPPPHGSQCSPTRSAVQLSHLAQSSIAFIPTRIKWKRPKKVFVLKSRWFLVFLPSIYAIKNILIDEYLLVTE